MDNNFENQNENAERRMENNGGDNAEATSPDTERNEELRSFEGHADSAAHADVTDDASGASHTENPTTADRDGEYRYSGSQIGDFGRERMGNAQSGSYTHRGSYDQSGNRNGAGFGQQNEGSGGQSPYVENSNGQNPYDHDSYTRGFYGQDPNEHNSNVHNPNVRNPYGQGPYGMPPFTPPPANGGKHKKGGVSRAALAVTVVVSIFVSAAAGFGGAYAYNSYYGEDTSPTVIYKSSESEGTDKTDKTTSTGEKGVYTDVAATVKDSVVEIVTESQVTGFFQYVSEGAGSGVIISEDGKIITNNHVIVGSSENVADTITVRLTNGNEYKAQVVGRDSDSDIAVIKIDADEKLSYAEFGDSDELTVGEEVIAVGNPLGELGGTVTNGVISALDREINVDGTTMNLLQTNAAINPGNSGGGLFNMKGKLIGVVNAKSSGSGIEGLGFAIPSNDALEVSRQLIENGYVTGKVFLGVSFIDVSDAYTAYRYFKSQAVGVYVADLTEGYNDDVLKYGDRIVAVDGNEITEFSQIKDILKEHSVGDKLKFTVYRNGKLTELDVNCYEYVPDDAAVDFGDID